MWKIGIFILIGFFLGSYTVTGSIFSEPVPVQNTSANSRGFNEQIACQWVPHNISLLPVVPPYAVLGGFDKTKALLYVGRHKAENGMNIVKVNVYEKSAYFTQSYREKFTGSYELLTGIDFAWIPVYNRVPFNAIIAGKSQETNENIYIGRAYYKETLTIGKIYENNKKLFIPYNGKEMSFQNFEVLVGPMPECI